MRPFAALLLLAGCSTPLGPPAFAGAGPNFNPLTFFTGHVTSWGVEENRAGDPIALVTTDCTGIPTGPHRIRMTQTLHVGNAPSQTRIWQFAQTGPNTFTATANDMDGATTGVASGPEFHWRWILETNPGNFLANVTMEQYMYETKTGDVMIRTIVTKLGFRLIEVSELFIK